MLFIIVNAALFAIFLMIVVVPPLYLYDPARHAAESHVPPAAGEVILDEGVPRSVKQKLYLLLVIPACTAANALFLYFAYYRPVRFVHYRVELHLLTLRSTLEARCHQMRKSGVLAVGNRSIAGGGVSASSFVMNSSIVSSDRSGVSARHDYLDQGRSPAQRLANAVKWGWRQHVRPKSVRKDAWVNSAVFAEIGKLRDEVELRFLTEGNVAEENFARAVIKTVGASEPSACAKVLGQVDDTVAEAEEQNDFYLSTRPPLATLHPTCSDPQRSAQDGTASDDKAAPPRRDNSVPPASTESPHRVHLRESTMPGRLRGSKFQFCYHGPSTDRCQGNTNAALPQAVGGNFPERHHEPVEMEISPVEQEGIRAMVHSGKVESNGSNRICNDQENGCSCMSRF
ncbi:hypothetical protein LSCM4_05872 [Leishmania orientalis]|uniref:Uncharacterized protein n=1 Tax=Leishmania orientalis TaxID=2249476 RepID=A0A836GTJ7_9TRYP|nr:hypothetical protein LSCM4_05872 [Leishmania orientalis]